METIKDTSNITQRSLVLISYNIIIIKLVFIDLVDECSQSFRLKRTVGLRKFNWTSEFFIDL